MLEGYPREWDSYIQDYKVNIIQPYALSKDEINRFSSDFKQVAKFIKYSKDKERLISPVRSDHNYEDMDSITAAFIKEVTGTKLKFKTKEGRINMCKAMDDWEDEIRAEERAKAHEIMKSLERERKRADEAEKEVARLQKLMA